MMDSDRTNTADADQLDLAEEFYERELLPKLMPTEKGKILVLDVESYDYEVDADWLAASDRLQSRHPGAFEFAFRIGYPAVVTLGRGVDVIEL
ncbi:MAG: hypothetical protein OXE87_10440 [Chloroflexi bacterium]|nr:hypothetical protein [Chloroflexota bacterium]